METERKFVEELDSSFADFVVSKHIPGAIYALVARTDSTFLGSQRVHIKSAGMANLERSVPVQSNTRFRIASMTKSFVGLAILMLRDRGLLSLSDAVSQYLPHLRIRPLSQDAPTLTILHLLSMAGGLPQDDPWADRAMDMTAKQFEELLAEEMSPSTPLGVCYEYSNFGFMCLGLIITSIAGCTFQDYITKEILLPLGMTETSWDYTDPELADGKFAKGYRYHNWSGKYIDEEIVHDAAMGGIITTMDDFIKYVSFHMNAWPPRDDEDSKLVAKRSTIREMHNPMQICSPCTFTHGTRTYNRGYSCGISWKYGTHLKTFHVGHAGGLPGYGSNWECFPELGLAVIGFSNLTYGPMFPFTYDVIEMLNLHNALVPKPLEPPPYLLKIAEAIEKLIVSKWKIVEDHSEIFADNFFKDQDAVDLGREIDLLCSYIGNPIRRVRFTAPNQLRGTLKIECERTHQSLFGSVNGDYLSVFFSLSPEPVPKVQAVSMNVVDGLDRKKTTGKEWEILSEAHYRKFHNTIFDSESLVFYVTVN